MSDMKVDLIVRARATGANVLRQQQAAVKQLGQVSVAEGAKIKAALRDQDSAWQRIKRSTTVMFSAIRTLGGATERVGEKARTATDTLKQGLKDDTRTIREASIETDRFNRGLDRMRSVAIRSTATVRTMMSTVRAEYVLTKT